MPGSAPNQKLKWHQEGTGRAQIKELLLIKVIFYEAVQAVVSPRSGRSAG